MVGEGARFTLPDLNWTLLKSAEKTKGSASDREWRRDPLPQGPSDEFPGLSWLIGGHGRCVAGHCECFPPFRGSSCQIEDRGLPLPRVRGAVIWYLAHDTEEDVSDLCTSL